VRRIRLFLLLYFLSGAAALLYEIVRLCLLTLSMGHTAAATSTGFALLRDARSSHRRFFASARRQPRWSGVIARRWSWRGMPLIWRIGTSEKHLPPLATMLLVNLGMTELRAANAPAAAERFSEALFLYPTLAPALDGLAKAFELQGQSRRAAAIRAARGQARAPDC
jgi:hypothetical protein